MSAHGNWAAVGAAVRERMAAAALEITADGLARTTGLSPATIRGVLKGTGRRQRGTLDTLSKALGWPFEYLLDVADGQPHTLRGLTLADRLARIERKVEALRADLASMKGQALPAGDSAL